MGRGGLKEGRRGSERMDGRITEKAVRRRAR